MLELKQVFSQHILCIFTGCWKGARPVRHLVQWHFILGSKTKTQTDMDTRFPLLHPKHYCVKVTGERPCETNQSHEGEQQGEQSRTGRQQETGECRAGGGEEALLLTCDNVEKEESRRRRSDAVGRRDLGQVEEGGRSEPFWRRRGGMGGCCVTLSNVRPRTLWHLQEVLS